MKNLLNLSFICLLTATLLFSSCTEDAEVVKDFAVPLKAAYEIPVTSRAETGSATLSLLDDNTLEFTITVTGLSSTDALTAAHLHTGAPHETGDVIVALVDGTEITFDGNQASGTVTVTSTVATAITTDAIYLNVHSTEVPAGLVRGQLNEDITWSANVILSPDNEVPAVTGRPETGVCALRVNQDGRLYYWINVGELSDSDELTAAHIHEGAAGTNGAPVHILADEASDFAGGFDVLGTLDLLDADVTALQDGDHYVNVHSVQAPDGLLRGQVE